LGGSPSVGKPTIAIVHSFRTADVTWSCEALAAEGYAIKVADKAVSYNTGLRQFFDEETYKPTLGSFKIGAIPTDQRTV